MVRQWLLAALQHPCPEPHNPDSLLSSCYSYGALCVSPATDLPHEIESHVAGTLPCAWNESNVGKYSKFTQGEKEHNSNGDKSGRKDNSTYNIIHNGYRNAQHNNVILYLINSDSLPRSTSLWPLLGTHQGSNRHPSGANKKLYNTLKSQTTSAKSFQTPRIIPSSNA